MIKISIVCVGKIKEKFFRDAIDEYSKRLSRYSKLNIIEVADEMTPDGASAVWEDQIREKEGVRILAKLPQDALIVTLEIAGRNYSSEEFAAWIEDCSVRGKSHICFVIGGSLGLHNSVCKRADLALSFSKMTFPHQLMRVILCEQIYRAFRIIQHEPYHKYKYCDVNKSGENMTKKQRALEIIERLKKEYPDAGCTLDYDQAWKLLVSVRLAAQCTDARVNIVVEKLYEKFPDVDALADAPVEEIEAIVKSCGLGHSKARDISACMKILRDKYQGKVPDDFDELLSLPGVGRKSANLVMGDVFGKPAIVTDTHCIRLVNRMGLVDGIKEPAKVEKELWKIIPPEEGSDFCHRLVYHGREVCTARTHPYCEKCCISDICKKVGV